MLNLENIAANEIGLTEDMMTENAARGIAEVALMALVDPGIQVQLDLNRAKTSTARTGTRSTIVVLAGNNKTGTRAIAAGRHLRSKGVHVIICLVGIEREQDLLDDLRQQVRIHRNLGGKVFSKQEFFEQTRPATNSDSPTTTTLIIDALLGLTLSFDELRMVDRASVYELVEWANRNEAFVLAVDVPTGIDPTTGKVNIVDGSPLYIKPRYVVAMGAPKRGLLGAMAPPADGETGIGLGNGESLTDDEEWRLFIADIGLGPRVWRKAGTKLRHGIDFQSKWVLGMRYQSFQDGDGNEFDEDDD
jgi:enhancer of mRNA-decapping protein 3